MTDSEIRAELERVLSSESFLKSPQLSRFLRYCVEETLKGQQDSLKEQVLGTDVFRRPAPFDPRLDPIVRVEARRLRSKLDQYYATEGSSNQLRITMQRGDYVPRFMRPPRAEGPAPPMRHARVLVVEDEALVARDLQNRLSQMGYEVIGAVASGEDAVQKVQDERPDVVLMDIVLAGRMRGTEAATRIWSGWRVPVIYVTAFTDMLVLEEMKGSNPYGFVLKPFDPKELNTVIQLALSRREREMAEAAVSRELPSSERLLSALVNSGIRMIDWVIRNPMLPWPDSVEEAPQPTSNGRLTPAIFLESILPEDRERVRSALTAAIQSDQSRFDIAYRRASQTEPNWVVLSGAIAEDSSGRLRCTGLEVAESSISHND